METQKESPPPVHQASSMSKSSGLYSRIKNVLQIGNENLPVNTLQYSLEDAIETQIGHSTYWLEIFSGLLVAILSCIFKKKFEPAPSIHLAVIPLYFQRSRHFCRVI